MSFTHYLEMYVETINSFYSNWYALLPILIFSYYASKNDIKELKIPNDLNKAFLISRILFAYWVPITSDALMGGIVGLLLILIPAMIILKPMGGDIKFVAVLGLWTNDAIILTSLLLGIILFVGFAYIKNYDKKHMIAFGPFVSLGFVLLTILVLIIKAVVFFEKLSLLII